MSLTDKIKGIVANEQQQAASPKAVPATQQAGGALAEADLYDSLPIQGDENVTAADLVIPRIVILQGLSPQLDKNKPEYIKDASSGDFCDVATGEVWKEGVTLIPCYYAPVALEWAPRGSAKTGLIANHGVWNDDHVKKIAKENEERRWVTPEGNFIARTATFFVLNMSAGGRRSFVPLTSTQLKNASQWNTLIKNEKRPSNGRMVPAPLFYRSWEAYSVGQSNAKGSWNGWKFRPGKTTFELGGKDLLDEAVAFAIQSKELVGRVDFSGTDSNTDEEHSDKM